MTPRCFRRPAPRAARPTVLALLGALGAFGAPALPQLDGGSVDDPVDVVTPGIFYPVPLDRGISLGQDSVTSTLDTDLVGTIGTWYAGTCQPPAQDCVDFLPDFAPPQSTIGQLVEDSKLGPSSGIADLRSAGVFPGASATDLTWVFAERGMPPDRFFAFMGLNPTEDFGFIDRFTGVSECASCAKGWYQYLQRGAGSWPTADASYDLVSVSVEVLDPGRVRIVLRTAGGVPSAVPSFAATPRSAPAYEVLFDVDAAVATGTGGFDRSVTAVWAGSGWTALSATWSGSEFVPDGVPVEVGVDSGALTLETDLASSREAPFRWLADSALHLLGPAQGDLWSALVDITAVVSARPTVEPELQPETVIAGPATQPRAASVATDPGSGRSAVVWEAMDGSGTGVFVQFLNEDGEPDGAAFEAAADPFGDQKTPRAAWVGGRLVVVWNDDGRPFARSPESRLRASVGSSSIVSRGFDPDGGAPTREVDVSGAGTSSPSDPSLAADRSGETVVGWKDGRGRGQGRVIDVPEILFDGSSEGPIVLPGVVLDFGSDEEIVSQVVAASATGDFLVAAERAAGGITARALRADGTPKGDAVLLSERAGASAPAIATSSSGRTLVAWDAPGDDGRDVFGRVLDADARPLGPARRLNQGTAGDQERVTLASNSVGDFVVAWESRSRDALRGSGGRAALAGGSGPSIVSRFFDPNGSAQSDDVEVAEADAGGEPSEPEVAIDDRDRASVVFTRRRAGRSEGVFRRAIDAELAVGSCAESDDALCLTQDRFRVTVQWRDGRGAGGAARAVSLTGDTGYFWFFNEENVELVIKVLDACAINDRFWVFAGGLTDVEVDITVDDVVSGVTRSYFNGLGRAFQPVQDTSAFATCGRGGGGGARRAPLELLETALGDWKVRLEGLLSAPRAFRDEAAAPPRPVGVCADGDTLCLLAERFEIDVAWQAADGMQGVGHPVSLTSDTGYFWFFNEENVELVIKVLDACAINDRFWVFAGGLTNVEAEITVTDRRTGETVRYRNEQGVAFAPVQDTSAFSTCAESSSSRSARQGLAASAG